MNCEHGKRRLRGLGAVAVALALAGCSSLVQTDHAMVLPGSTNQAESDNPVERGHRRDTVQYAKRVVGAVEQDGRPVGRRVGAAGPQIQSHRA